MTAPKNKPVSPEDFLLFVEYYEANPVWGSLHIVLDDFNYEDRHIKWCSNYAQENGDAQGQHLAQVLLGLSWSQRERLGHKVELLVENKWRDALLKHPT